ncbi:MAG: hypothetical protein RBR34_06900 [Rhodospirillaceae bacterium]|nr:hypothetical protein [Rhodospirillaceae bacterium]
MPIRGLRRAAANDNRPTSGGGGLRWLVLGGIAILAILAWGRLHGWF